MSQDSRQRFGPRADNYAAYRPSHAPEAVDAVLEGLGDPTQLVIADVGAGTGISSELFADRGATVIAIEPNAAMRAKAKPHPRIHWRDGSAEATALSDKSVDVVVACQAFHWFATPAVLAEFARIARRRAAILQYERDESDRFTQAYGDIVRAYATDDTEAMRRRALDAFESLFLRYAVRPGIARTFVAPHPCGAPTRALFRSRHPGSAEQSRRLDNAGPDRVPHDGSLVRKTVACSTQTMDLQTLLGRAASASYLPATGEMGERLAADLRVLFDRFARDGTVTMHLVTYALVADLAR